MADIRCPMCGKPNPDDLEICQFCQARLKPARSSETGGPAASSLFGSLAASEDDELPEWLRDLRPQAASPAPAGEPEESLPEWLSTEKPSAPAAPAVSSAFSDEGLDWLS